ncbi:hypothetical protein [Amycolatopsis sp. SID8362]|uniref:hypothetical protein n=1 Tax=Amycolatopsis sp. SID8362 TaxID=2690346 RepID=UPI00136BB1DF|nr:hypothetical protein [Amycolatopsis sp. SID8362]NBH02586.1 hypothetical protein [Amycolatopsis sp. SID8362]NED39288.1 hypothetical protein [Amycolatopsis sp. SID8362]
MKLLLPAVDGTVHGLGPAESTFTSVDTEDAARRIAEDLVGLLVNAPGNAAGVVEMRDDKVTLAHAGV